MESVRKLYFCTCFTIDFQVNPDQVYLNSKDVSAIVTIKSTLPLACDSYPVWKKHGHCELNPKIMTHGTGVTSGREEPGLVCKLKLDREMTEDSITVVAKQRMGTSRGTYTTTFEPIGVIFANTIWDDYVLPPIQVNSTESVLVSLNFISHQFNYCILEKITL